MLKKHTVKGEIGMRVGVKRIYAAPAAEDGYRVLVDRIWPRGVRKEAAAIDAWLKELAPSTELRRWFAHEASRWPEFCRRYRAELDARQDLVRGLLAKANEGALTLLFAARDEEHNNAVALRQYLLERERG
ncbi:MAG: DUF488 family protein [Desulfuromonadales bacterium]